MLENIQNILNYHHGDVRKLPNQTQQNIRREYSKDSQINTAEVNFDCHGQLPKYYAFGGKELIQEINLNHYEKL